MAYTPKTWVCGETITADGLNNIEDGIQEALECCGSGGDCGYECTESRETAFEGNLTTTSWGGRLAELHLHQQNLLRETQLLLHSMAQNMNYLK